MPHCSRSPFIGQTVAARGPGRPAVASMDHRGVGRSCRACALAGSAGCSTAIVQSVHRGRGHRLRGVLRGERMVAVDSLFSRPTAHVRIRSSGVRFLIDEPVLHRVPSCVHHRRSECFNSDRTASAATPICLRTRRRRESVLSNAPSALPVQTERSLARAPIAVVSFYLARGVLRTSSPTARRLPNASTSHRVVGPPEDDGAVVLRSRRTLGIIAVTASRRQTAKGVA